MEVCGCAGPCSCGCPGGEWPCLRPQGSGGDRNDCTRGWQGEGEEEGAGGLGGAVERRDGAAEAEFKYLQRCRWQGAWQAWPVCGRAVLKGVHKF